MEPDYPIDASLNFVGDQLLFKWRRLDGTECGKFIAPSAARAAFSHVPIDTGWIKPGVTRWGMNHNGEWTVIFIPPSVHKLILNPKAKRPISAPLPGLVFLHQEHNSHVWAISEPEFSPEAIVHYAPLPNVGSDGRICFGSNSISGLNTMATWTLFIGSPFNNHSANGKSKLEPTDVRNLLKQLSGKKEYPVNDLVLPARYDQKTVDRAIRDLVK